MDKKHQHNLQLAEEALVHAVVWDGIAHLSTEKAQALLEELLRLRDIEDRFIEHQSAMVRRGR